MSPPDGGKFARCLGAFIMNCSVLEFHPYTWMSCLSPRFELPPKASKLSLDVPPAVSTLYFRFKV
jgi:hypothetical protein